jgi:hypothetical protein
LSIRVGFELTNGNSAGRANLRERPSGSLEDAHLFGLGRS